jgi:hypothetical protein
LRELRSASGGREWAAAGITLACLVWLALNAELPSLQEAAGRASYGPLGVALCLSLLAVVCKAARWRALYPPLVRPKLGLAIAGVAAGQVANWAIPARLGEALRVGLVSSAGIAPVVGTARTVSLSIGVLVAEKLLDGAMLLVMVAALALFGGLPGWLSTMGLLFVAAASAGGLVLAVLLKNWQGQPDGGWSRGEIARPHAASPPESLQPARALEIRGRWNIRLAQPTGRHAGALVVGGGLGPWSYGELLRVEQS